MIEQNKVSYIPVVFLSVGTPLPSPFTSKDTTPQPPDATPQWWVPLFLLIGKLVFLSLRNIRKGQERLSFATQSGLNSLCRKKGGVLANSLGLSPSKTVGPRFIKKFGPWFSRSKRSFHQKYLHSIDKTPPKKWGDLGTLSRPSFCFLSHWLLTLLGGHTFAGRQLAPDICLDKAHFCSTVSGSWVQVSTHWACGNLRGQSSQQAINIFLPLKKRFF